MAVKLLAMQKKTYGYSFRSDTSQLAQWIKLLLASGFASMKTFCTVFAFFAVETLQTTLGGVDIYWVLSGSASNGEDNPTRLPFDVPALWSRK